MSDTMTAADVRAALSRRWPDSEYLVVNEAPTNSDRSGRKIDVLAVSLWRSRGLEIDAVEVKVSLSDWKREMATGAKAEFWFTHSHRFWLAVPAALAPKVRDDLPSGWGLLACEREGAPKTVVKPERRVAEPLGWSACVGLLRAAADAGVNAITRAYNRGRNDGFQSGKAEGQRLTGEGGTMRAYENLRHRVEKFERASGLSLANDWDIDSIGEIVALVRAEMRDPGWLADNLARQAKFAGNAAAEYAKNARELEQKAAAVAAIIANAATQASADPTHPEVQRWMERAGKAVAA